MRLPCFLSSRSHNAGFNQMYAALLIILDNTDKVKYKIKISNSISISISKAKMIICMATDEP